MLVLSLLTAPALAGPVAAQSLAPGFKQPETPLQMVAALPEVAAGWRRGAVTDFEARPNGAGLGAGAEYRPAAGGPGVATVYRYDRGLAPAVALASLDAEMDQAMREVELLGPQRRYRVEGRQPAEPVTGPDGRPVLRCEALVLTFEGGPRAEGSFCLGLVRGRFLKLRMTLPPGAPGAAAAAVQAFGREIVAVAQ
ncbi:hypothetical protein ACFQY5_11360 [Paeniroseomonas aquatica]|uniref:Uncharacterized protein n=1 Tax=Paeniroseomonas aquatica TaxID=373043 RepID=A0ABT8A7L8_9PROT|nr:hypothetical protein [Paeniroseomonas aquatica]MDN3565737.1 hypothetical protein [Paeniroseomonas aquatica]